MTNPFSTRHIRPGAIPFFFPPGQSAKGLVDLLRSRHWRGAIVGPHGSGKSSLVAALVSELRGAGRVPLLLELHDGQRRLPVDLHRCGSGAPGGFCETVVIVDGYEQLSRLNRLRLRWFCRRRRWGLLVTSHRPTDLPLLCRTSTSPTLACQIVAWLLRDRQDATIDPTEIARRFNHCRGDLREMLFELYDHCEP